MGKPIILIGYGGHGRVLAALLDLLGRNLLGYTAPQQNQTPVGKNEPAYLGSDKIIENYTPSEIELVNGIGSVGDSKIRRQIYEDFSGKGYVFPALIHPAAIIAKDVEISAGAQIMAGAIVQTGTQIGENAIINTSASIDHDCHIKSHTHLAPGCVLSGGVVIESGVHIGTGAVLIQSIHIGREAIIGAGSTVLNDIEEKQTAIGSPAKPKD